MQLDLFTDSRDAMLRNVLVEALRNRDLPAGRMAHRRLAAACPQDAVLAPAALLLDQLARGRKPFSDPIAARQALAHIDGAVRCAAAQVFGHGKTHQWLVPLWQALAEATATLPFHPDAPEGYSAAFLTRAGQWQQARTAVEAIPSWRRIPHVLAWASEIAFALDGLEDAWPLLAELAWLDPVRFAAVARRLPAPPLARLLRDFDRDLAADDDAELAWFPAWSLIAEPELAVVLCHAHTPVQSAPEQATQVVLQLSSLERQGRQHEVIAKRKALRTLHEALFERYMATRA